MADSQQTSRPQAHRTWTGKDILSRMLQMEKQTKQKRSSFAGPTTTNSQDRPEAFTPPAGRSSFSASKAPHSQGLTTPGSQPQHPIPRSQTLPDMFQQKNKKVPPRQSLTLDTSKGVEDFAPAEICLSPSWSDHGEKQRKKERKQREKAQKELVRKARQEEDKKRASEAKAGKRLSKQPPPAAMDTQRGSSRLRRNSLASVFSTRSSSESSRRNSSVADKRLSAASFSSIQSNHPPQSTPATSTETSRHHTNGSDYEKTSIGSTAPRLPRFQWHSGRSSSSTSKSNSWGSETAADKDFINFAYRLDSYTNGIEFEKENTSPSQATMVIDRDEQPQHPANPRINGAGAQTLNNGTNGVNQRSPRLASSRDTGSQFRDTPAIESSPLDNKAINNVQISPKSKTFGRITNGNASPKLPTAQDHQSSPQNSRPMQLRPSHDGSSYVHKQRMYEQQMSIAGFEDQEAVQLANQLANAEAFAAERRGSIHTVSSSETASGHAESDDKGIADRPEQEGDRRRSQSRHSHEQSRRRSSTPSRHAQTKQPQKATPLSQTTNNDSRNGVPRQITKTNSTPLQREEAVTLNQPAPGSTTEKILGFRHRAKAPPSKIAVQEGGERRGSKTGKQRSPEIPQIVEPTNHPKRTDSKQPPTHLDTVGRRESAPFPGSFNFFQDEPATNKGHSRTRTSSSQLLSEGMPSPILPQDLFAASPTTPSMAVTESGQPAPTTESKQESKQETAIERSPSGATQRKTKSLGSDAQFRALLRRESDGSSAKVAPIPKTIRAAVTPQKPEITEAEAVKPQTTKIETPVPETVKSETGNELVVASANAEGLVRKTSITKSRSTPHLPTQNTLKSSLPSLDFLPQLKHQPLVKSKRAFVQNDVPTPPAIAVSQFPAALPASATEYKPPAAKPIIDYKSPASKLSSDLALLPRSGMRPLSHASGLPATAQKSPIAPPLARSATSIIGAGFEKDSNVTANAVDAKPVAKLFVICCKCKFWHDLPSKLYEAMALPKELKREEAAAVMKGKSASAAPSTAKRLSATETTLETAVKCPWCEHAMTTWCCQGWTTVVYLHQRHH